MAEYSSVAIREYRGHPKSPLGKASMPVGVDAAMQGMQATEADPCIDRSGSQAKRHKLPPRDDPMLPRCERRKSSFSLRVRLTLYVGVKFTRNESLPSWPLIRRRC